MNRERIIWWGAVASIVMLVAMVVAAILSWRKYKQLEPQITQLENTSSNVGSLYSLLSKG